MTDAWIAFLNAHFNDLWWLIFWIGSFGLIRISYRK